MSDPAEDDPVEDTKETDPEEADSVDADPEEADSVEADPEDDGRPAWYEWNEQAKAELGIAPYEAPRFRDGHRTFEVVPELERRHDCTVRFVGKNTHYPDDWEVWVDGDAAFSVGRHRDANGNTVYEIDADRFRRAVERHLAEADED